MRLCLFLLSTLSLAARGEDLGRSCHAPLDIVFVQDSTNSYGPALKKMVAQLPEFVSYMDRNIPDVRLSVVDFRDRVGYLNDPTKYCYNAEDGALSWDRDKFISAYNRISVAGGGRNPENSYQALIYAAKDPKIGWRKVLKSSSWPWGSLDITAVAPPPPENVLSSGFLGTIMEWLTVGGSSPKQPSNPDKPTSPTPPVLTSKVGAKIIVLCTDDLPDEPTFDLPENHGEFAGDYRECSEMDYPSERVVRRVLQQQNIHVAFLVPESDTDIVHHWKRFNEEVLGQPSSFYEILSPDSSDFLDGLRNVVSNITSYSCEHLLETPPPTPAPTVETVTTTAGIATLPANLVTAEENTRTTADIASLPANHLTAEESVGTTAGIASLPATVFAEVPKQGPCECQGGSTAHHPCSCEFDLHLPMKPKRIAIEFFPPSGGEKRPCPTTETATHDVVVDDPVAIQPPLPLTTRVRPKISTTEVHKDMRDEPEDVRDEMQGDEPEDVGDEMQGNEPEDVRDEMEGDEPVRSPVGHAVEYVSTERSAVTETELPWWEWPPLE